MVSVNTSIYELNSSLFWIQYITWQQPQYHSTNRYWNFDISNLGPAHKEPKPWELCPNCREHIKGYLRSLFIYKKEEILLCVCVRVHAKGYYTKQSLLHQYWRFFKYFKWKLLYQQIFVVVLIMDQITCIKRSTKVE